MDERSSMRGGNVPGRTTGLELIEVLGGDIGEVMRELARRTHAVGIVNQNGNGHVVFGARGQ